MTVKHYIALLLKFLSKVRRMCGRILLNPCHNLHLAGHSADTQFRNGRRSYLRNRKHVLCFYRVLVLLVFTVTQRKNKSKLLNKNSQELVIF